MRRFARTLLVGCAVGVVACDEPGASPVTDGEAAHGCGALEVPGPDGCLPVGVPPGECGEGFEADDRGGCDPLLPEAPCPEGAIAVPGEITCGEIVPCGAAPWGDAPEGAGAQYVNGAYFAGNSDGSAAKPWATIQAGVDAAPEGATVLVAAGTYAEDVRIMDSSVHLWGRCPAMVEIVGTGLALATVIVAGVKANGTEIHGVAVGGAHVGIAVAGAAEVVLDGLWIHDTKGRGLDLVSEGAPASVHVVRSLVERTREIGVLVAGADVVIEDSSVRDIGASATNVGGAGVFVRSSDAPVLRGKVTLLRSVVERNLGAGLVALGADAELERTVVRDTGPLAAGQVDGEGVIATYDAKGLSRSSLTLRRSVVERNHEAGVAVVGSDATLDAVTVRATGAQISDGTSGTGLAVQIGDSGQRAVASVTRSLVADSLGMGVFVAQSDVTLDASLVSAVLPREVDGLYGDALLVASYAGEASVVLTASRIERGARAGISSFGAEVTLGGSLIHCNAIALDGEVMDGRAFSFQDLGDNACGCTAPTDLIAAEPLAPCKVISANLAPPPAVTQ